MSFVKGCVSSSQELLGSPPSNETSQSLSCKSSSEKSVSVDCGPMYRGPDPCHSSFVKSTCSGGVLLRFPPSSAPRHRPPAPLTIGGEGGDDAEYMEGCRRVGDHSYRLWKDQKMCDVIIKCCGGEEVKAHKTVLSTYSDFMAENFSQFPDGEAVSIDLPEFSIDIVMLILHFVYTREVDVNKKTVGPLLKCADELGICELVRMCVEFLSCVSVDNAIYFYAIADNFGLAELKDRIYKFILENFLEICTTKHFAYLHPDRLVSLLSDDRLRVHSELDVFNAAVFWLDHNRPDRLPLAPVVLQCAVRLLCISPDCLVKKVECVAWIFDIPECQMILNDAIRYHALKLSGSRLACAYPQQKHRGTV